VSGDDDRSLAQDAADEPEEPPPLLGSWQRLYALVVFELLVTAALLYALARWAA
jgi:hypothetical protein